MNHFFCNLCNVPLTSGLDYESHYFGKKHQKALKVAQRIEMKEKCGVFVTGFPDSVDENQIMKHFSMFGKMSDHYFDKNKKFLIVEYTDPHPVDVLLRRHNFFQGRKLIVKRRLVKDKQQDEVNIDPPSLDTKGIISKLKDLVDFDKQVKVFVSEICKNKHDLQKKYHSLSKDLEETLQMMFPGCKLYRFGSTTTGLGFESSDVDIYCRFKDEDPSLAQDRCVNRVRNFLSKHKTFKKICSMPHARTPIVKFVHVPTTISCDLNFRNMLGVLNSEFISFYLSLDDRLRILMLIIKFWAKIHGYSSGNTKFSNYALTMMLFFYLQQEPFDFPSIYSLQKNADEIYVDNWNASFSRVKIDMEKIRKTSLKDLLYGFFNFYATFDYGLYVVSPFLGKPILKLLFLEPELLPVELSLYKRNVSEKGMKELKVDRFLCVQDPFELNNNVTGGVQIKLLQMFCDSCKWATLVIENNMKKTILWNLFNEKPKSSDRKNSEVIIGFPSQVDFIKSRVEMETIDETKIRNAWFDFIREFLESVLIKVLKLEVKVKDDKSVNKTPKKEGQRDVHSSEYVNCVVFHCKGKYNVLDSRRSLGKTICSEARNVLESEIAISDYIKDVLLKDIIMDKYIVDFDVTLKCTRSPTEIVLTMNKNSYDPNYFQRTAGFITKAVTALAVKYINELESEQRLKT